MSDNYLACGHGEVSIPSLEMTHLEQWYRIHCPLHSIHGPSVLLKLFPYIPWMLWNVLGLCQGTVPENMKKSLIWLMNLNNYMAQGHLLSDKSLDPKYVRVYGL